MQAFGGRLTCSFLSRDEELALHIFAVLGSGPENAVMTRVWTPQRIGGEFVAWRVNPRS